MRSFQYRGSGSSQNGHNFSKGLLGNLWILGPLLMMDLRRILQLTHSSSWLAKVDSSAFKRNMRGIFGLETFWGIDRKLWSRGKCPWRFSPSINRPRRIILRVRLEFGRKRPSIRKWSISFILGRPLNFSDGKFLYREKYADDLIIKI